MLIGSQKKSAVKSFKKRNGAQNRKHLCSTIQIHIVPSLLYTACCSGTCLSKITWGMKEGQLELGTA